MVATLFRKKMSVIAMDFGACTLRAVQLKQTGRGWRVHHWVNIEKEPVTEHPPIPNYEAELRMAFGIGTFSGQKTSMLLSPPEVEYRLLDVPGPVLAKPSHELRAALQFELDRQMPWPAAESEVAAWSVSRDSTSAMVVAARSSSVQQFLDVLNTQHFECTRAELVPNAVIRACATSPVNTETAETNGSIWGAVDIGFRSARLYLIHEGRCIYARVIRGSGREFTETLAKALHVDFRIAEQYKRIYGIRQTDRGFRSIVGGLSRISDEDLPGVLYAIVRPTLDAVVGEIERSYRYAMGRLSGMTTGPLYLIGGGARLKGLVDVLGARLGVPVCLPDPKTALNTESASGQEHPLCNTTNYAAMAPCVGLALMEEDS
jgi:type IV pilus assembly protein PilM